MFKFVREKTIFFFFIFCQWTVCPECGIEKPFISWCFFFLQTNNLNEWNSPSFSDIPQWSLQTPTKNSYPTPSALKYFCQPATNIATCVNSPGLLVEPPNDLGFTFWFLLQWRKQHAARQNSGVIPWNFFIFVKNLKEFPSRFGGKVRIFSFKSEIGHFFIEEKTTKTSERRSCFCPILMAHLPHWTVDLLIQLLLVCLFCNLPHLHFVNIFFFWLLRRAHPSLLAGCSTLSIPKLRPPHPPRPAPSCFQKEHTHTHTSH